MSAWLTTGDCAQALGVSDDTVRRDIAAGLLVAMKRPTLGGRTRIRVHVESLRNYAREDLELFARVNRWLCSTGNVTPQQPQPPLTT